MKKELHQTLSYKVAKNIPGLLPAAKAVVNSAKERNYAKGRKTYSQYGEDIIIADIFGQLGIKNPSYIDIGAHHPYFLSNTALLYKAGSRGINIEPDPQLYARFTANRPQDTNLNIGVADKKGELTFYVMADPAFNTFSAQEAEKCEAWGCKIVSEITVPVETVQDIIEKYCKGKFPDFLSLDVEGLDEVIIKRVDFSTSGPLVVCVETINYENGKGVKNQETIDLLTNQGYVVYADTYINTIFVKKDTLKIVQ